MQLFLKILNILYSLNLRTLFFKKFRPGNFSFFFRIISNKLLIAKYREAHDIRKTFPIYHDIKRYDKLIIDNQNLNRIRYLLIANFRLLHIDKFSISLHFFAFNDFRYFA